MTVQTTESVATASGNGVTVSFPVGFKFNSSTDLVVVLIDDVTGDVTPQVLNSHYSVTGAGASNGGAVIFKTAPASGVTVKVSRVVDLLQQTDLRNQGKYFAEVHEDAFDLLVMMIQQISASAGVSLQLTEDRQSWDFKGRRGINAAAPINDQDVANKIWTLQQVGDLIAAIQGNPNNAANIFYLGVDGAARVVQDMSNTTDPAKGVGMLGRSIRHIASVSELRTVAGRSNGDQVQLVGYRTSVPGVGGGTLWWDATATEADNSGTVFAVSGVPTGRWRRVKGPHVSIEDFGAYEGQVVADCTAAINAAIDAQAGKPLFIPARRYKYNGTNTTSSMCIIGERPPVVSASLGSLENGSILEGTVTWRPTDGYFSSFGVDHGSDNFATAADALKIATSTPSGGRSVTVRDVVGLGRDPADLTHAVLIEGYGSCSIRGVTGVRNYFGLAVKCRQSEVDRVYAVSNGLYGVIVKSDTTNGTTSDFQISNVIVEGNSITAIGLQIESADAVIQRLNISGINVRACTGVLRVAGGVTATDISISNIVGNNITGDAIRQTGTAYNLQISNVVLSALTARAANFADTRHLTVTGFSAAAANSGSANFNTDFFLIGASCVRTNLTAVNLNNNYSSTAGAGGMIKYDNTAAQNVLGAGYWNKTGVGAP